MHKLLENSLSNNFHRVVVHIPLTCIFQVNFLTKTTLLLSPSVVNSYTVKSPSVASEHSTMDSVLSSSTWIWEHQHLNVHTVAITPERSEDSFCHSTLLSHWQLNRAVLSVAVMYLSTHMIWLMYSASVNITTVTVALRAQHSAT